MMGYWIGSILILAVVIIFIIIPVLNKFYKGRIRRIKVVNKRTTSRDMLNFSYTQFNESNYATFVLKLVAYGKLRKQPATRYLKAS